MGKDNNPYKDTEWALTAEAKELRDILNLMGMEMELAMATLERLLPENVLYRLDKAEDYNG